MIKINNSGSDALWCVHLIAFVDLQCHLFNLLVCSCSQPASWMILNKNVNCNSWCIGTTRSLWLNNDGVLVYPINKAISLLAYVLPESLFFILSLLYTSFFVICYKISFVWHLDCQISNVANISTHG